MRDLRGTTEWYHNGEKMESEHLKGPQCPQEAKIARSYSTRTSCPRGPLPTLSITTHSTSPLG